jgi:hypothetical protein
MYYVLKGELAQGQSARGGGGGGVGGGCVLCFSND